MKQDFDSEHQNEMQSLPKLFWTKIGRSHPSFRICM